METEYKSNSHKSKAIASETTTTQVKTVPEKKVTKAIVKGTVKKKNKIVDAFVSEDTQNIKNYIVMEVLIPAIKKAVVDIVTDGISMMLYGDTSHGRRSSSSASYISYNKYSDRRDDRSYASSRSRYSYDDIVLQSRSEAEEVLDAMYGMLETYGVVSVADMYDLVGVSGNYTDNKYGWTNLRNAEPIRVGNGYMLKLPKAMPID